MFKIFKSLIYYEYDVPLSTISTIMSYICTGLIFVKINNNSLNFINFHNQRCTYRNSQIKINHLNVLHFSSPTCYMSSSRLACVDLGEGGPTPQPPTPNPPPPENSNFFLHGHITKKMPRTPFSSVKYPMDPLPQETFSGSAHDL